MADYPGAITPVNHVEPVPRRIRGTVGTATVFDTTGARYVWEWPFYPRYYVPVADIQPGVLEFEGETRPSPQGTADVYGLRVGDRYRAHAVTVMGSSTVLGVAGLARFEWSALDAWYEEDEQVFVHPRNPYVRVDALRSTRRVRVEVDGVGLAESSAPVMVFETGLPTRYYLNRTEVDFSHLVPSDTVSECPYKGTTSQYWSVDVGGVRHRDLGWSYDFPTRQLLAVAGMVCFYNEKVDIFIDGGLLERPETHFFASDE